jgi:hypothetical protein
MIGKSVRAALMANTEVVAAIANRCYPLVLPQNSTLPAIRYQVISRIDEADSVSELWRWRVQLACHASSYDTAHDLAHKAIKALKAYNNKAATYGAFAIIPENMSDDHDPDLNEYTVYFDIFAYSRGE